LATPDILTALHDNGLARAITKSNHLVIAGLQIIHMFGFLLLLASLVVMSLRLLGLALRQQSVSQVTRQPAALFWWGLATAAISGSLMFLTGPRHYFQNSAFEAKMLLLPVAVLMQVFLFRRAAASESSGPVLARTSAVLSLILWFGVGIAGRAIGFV
jgi:hypothetical protein